MYIDEFRIFFSSTSSGVFTGSHWRCSTSEEADWFARYFDDSNWSNAYLRPYSTTYSVNSFLSNFETGSRMIWHFDYTYDGPVYCRVKVGYGIFFFYSRAEMITFKFTLGCILSSVFSVYPQWISLAGASVSPLAGCTQLATLNDAETTVRGCLALCQVHPNISKLHVC